MTTPVSWSKFANDRPMSFNAKERVGYLNQALQISATKGRILQFSVEDIAKASRILRAAHLPEASYRCLHRMAKEQAIANGERSLEGIGK